MHLEKKACQLRQWESLAKVLLGYLVSWHSCGYYFETYHLTKHCCRSGIPIHGRGLSQPDKAANILEWFEEHDKSKRC